MTSDQAEAQYGDQIRRMTDLYMANKWTPGNEKEKDSKCAEDIMEAEVPEKHWIIVRRVMMDAIRKQEDDSTCIFCGEKFDTQHYMLSHRGMMHKEEVEHWRMTGIPADYKANMMMQRIMQKYNLRRSSVYRYLNATNTELREV